MPRHRGNSSAIIDHQNGVVRDRLLERTVDRPQEEIAASIGWNDRDD
jgi:hypothetical protein